MKSLLWVVLVVAALLWSAIAWGLHALAGAGGQAVIHASRWLMLPPENLQWLSDTMAVAGPAVQVVVLLLWGAGVAALLAVGLLAGRAARAGAALTREGMDVARGLARGERPTIDPAVRDLWRRDGK